MGSQPHSHAQPSTYRVHAHWSTITCTLASPAIPSTSLWGSAESPPQTRGRSPRREGVQQVWPQLRSPEISSGRRRAYAPLHSGGLLLLPGGPGPSDQSLQHPQHVPSPGPRLSGPICSSAIRTSPVKGNPRRPSTQPFVQPCCPSLGCFQQSLPTASRDWAERRPSPSHSPAICQPPKPTVFSP